MLVLSQKCWVAATMDYSKFIRSPCCQLFVVKDCLWCTRLQLAAVSVTMRCPEHRKNIIYEKDWTRKLTRWLPRFLQNTNRDAKYYGNKKKTLKKDKATYLQVSEYFSVVPEITKVVWWMGNIKDGHESYRYRYVNFFIDECS